jgi:hypothetical protein
MTDAKRPGDAGTSPARHPRTNLRVRKERKHEEAQGRVEEARAHLEADIRASRALLGVR